MKCVSFKINSLYFNLYKDIDINKSGINNSDLVIFDSSFEGGGVFNQDSIKKFLLYYKQKYKLENIMFLTMNEKASSSYDGIFYKNYSWSLYRGENHQRINLQKPKHMFTYLGGYARPDKCKTFNKLFEKDLLNCAIWSFSGVNQSVNGKMINPEALNFLPRSFGIDFSKKGEVKEYRKSWSEINIELYFSRFSLVQETEMTNASNRYTEKTFKCLSIGHPFIIAGNYQTLELLRKDGFKTFSPYIDESYDGVEDANERASLVVKEAERLCKMSETQWNELIMNIEPVLEHNFQRSKNI